MKVASIVVSLLRRFVLGCVYSETGPDNARCIFGHRAIFRSGNPVPYNHLNLFGYKRELCPSDTGPDNARCIFGHHTIFR